MVTSFTAPIFIDAVTDVDEFPFVRCNYLAIESDDPMPGWGLQIGSYQPVPFFMLGLQGIIVSPPGGEEFSSGNDVETTFKLLEECGFSVETGDLWFPCFLFKKHLADLVAGQVFRSSRELFGSAFRFRDSLTTWEEFAGVCRESEPPYFSQAETRAFDEWHRRVRANIQEQGFGRREQMLKPLDEDRT